MREKAYKYHREAEGLNKETFIEIYKKAYGEEISQIEYAAEQCWENYSNSNTFSKLKFIMDHKSFADLFEAYCMGFADGCEFTYNN